MSNKNNDDGTLITGDDESKTKQETQHSQGAISQRERINITKAVV